MAASRQSEAVAVIEEPMRKSTSQFAKAAPQAAALKDMAKTPQAASPKDIAKSVMGVTCDIIAQRAYNIWQKEGGSEMENWLKAEREVRS